MQKIHFYSQLRDRVLEGLLYVEKFKKDEFSINEAIAAQTLSLSRRELKPIYQKFKNNYKFSDEQLKEKGDAIGRDFEIAIAEDLAQAMAGGNL
jgi:hypothetical protein